MHITVQDLLNLPIFNAVTVLNGIEYLEDKNVEWVSAIEGPVENFVRKEELVVTSCMHYEKNPEDLLEFTKDVYESGASALGFAIGRYVFEIPQSVIDFANEHAFIVLELPWELRFADIQRATMEAIHQRQESYVEKARQLQKKLIDYVIFGKDLSEIIYYTEQTLNCQIVFIGSKERIKSTMKNPTELLELWDKLEESTAHEVAESEFRHMQKYEYEGGIIFKRDITSTIQNTVNGYFIIRMRDKALLTPTALQAFESLSAATALWISREDAIVQTETRLRNDFIWNLAKSEKKMSEKNILSRAKLLDYNLSVPYQCIVGYSENLEEMTDVALPKDEDSFKNIMFYMEEEIRYAAKVVGKHVAFTVDDEHIIIFLEYGADLQNSTVHHFLDLVDKRFNALVPGVIFSWGIGMHQDGIMTFHQSYKKAYAALDLNLKQKSAGERVSFDETQLNRLLIHLANDKEVKEITLTTIKPLIEYEEQREMDLIQTFIAYDNQNGNVSQAARVLNLHRQSLLYRLRKIESLTDLSLDNPDDVFLLSISIKVWMTGAISELEKKSD